MKSNYDKISNQISSNTAHQIFRFNIPNEHKNEDIYFHLNFYVYQDKWKKAGSIDNKLFKY